MVLSEPKWGQQGGAVESLCVQTQRTFLTKLLTQRSDVGAFWGFLMRIIA